MTVSLTREQWRTAIDEVSPATFGELVRVIADSDVVDGDPEAIVEDAIAEDGPLVEDESSTGAFPEYTLREEDETAESGAKRGAERDSPASNPTPDGEKTGSRTAEHRDRGVSALGDALEWFHQQLDRDLPDECDYETPRDYYREGRGWDSDTIDEKLLGYAPANYKDDLMAFLFDRGYGREEILATGLFGERDDGGLYTAWSGRYVLPYFDADGRPVFAISRATDPVHTADWKGNKYDKLQVTRDDVTVEEPIYGLETVREGEPVLITEGIADAITAHEAGYPCISPVTVQFKKSDREKLLDALDDRDVDRAYLIQDAERPTSSLDEEDRLTLQQFGDGVKGAVKTATYLSEHSIGARVADLPRAGLEKVDLDDYLQDWSDDLTPILASADPVDQHPAYEEPSDEVDLDADPTGISSETVSGNRSNRSALFDLDIRDVTGLSWGFRGKNPLGHHGDSENYFILTEDKGVAYDHKYKVAYNALTYLLVDAGERRPSSPNGDLDDSEVFAAWKHAKREGLLPDDDPIPHRALKHVALESDLAEADKIRDGWKLPTEGYNGALEVVREEHGLDTGRDPVTDGKGDAEAYRRDPTEAEVVLEPKRAWDAAEAVNPDDLGDQPLETDGDTWVEPGTGREVSDVVRAVAIAEYPDVDVDTPLTDRYADAYRIARDQYDAPLPEYLTQVDAVERFDYVLGAVRELTYWHLDEEALTADVTGEDGDVAGEAVRTLDPTPVDGWRDSESGTSVLVFPSGTVYDADLGEGGRVIDTLRFVATDVGLIDQPTDPLEGEDFTEAYRIARDEYGAPLPRWNAGTPDVTPVLPPAEDLVDDPDDLESAHDRLDDLRSETESLYRDAISDADTVDVLNVLPALGKTTSAIKTAGDQPTAYLAPRKELMEQAAEKASEHGASYQHLPVFSEANLDSAFVDIGVDAVRNRGKSLLRDRWELLDAVGATGNGEIYDEGEDGETETADLDRATCPTAEGEHGDAWALAVHVARALDYTPRDIHERAEALFGASLPCQDGEGETCDYTHGWDAVSNPDQPVDLLIGHYAHAHVESARTYSERAGNGRVRKSARAVVLDEFVGRAFTETFDEDALEHAVWLASALTDTVDDRQDLLERDVWDNELVRSWLKGEAAEEDGPTYGLVTSLRARSEALSAATTTAEVLEGREGVLKNHDLYEPLSRVRDEVLTLSSEERAAIAGTIRTTADTVEPASGGFRVIQWANDEVAGPLAESADYDLAVDPSQLPDGELRAFVKQALDSDQPGVLRAAATALSGGNDGARELSVFADDGYAHRKAHYLLEAAIRPPQERDTPKIHTEAFTFGTEDGTTLKHVKVNDKVTVVLDRNGRGAEVLQPPARTAGGGDPVPVVGLDATARRRLWEVALGDTVRVRDVHDSMRDRARTLRDVHDLQIVQTSDLAKSYEGDPDGKNLDGDVALLEAIADQYAGVHGPRDRDEEADVLGNPATITTKVVREVLENDDRLDDVVDTWDNYGNLKGSNDLADHRLAALLGSQHYGDAEIERFAALAGEEVSRTGYGMGLDYGSDVANTYLQHMREDQVMQAALRFARGGSGAVVFVHTAAIREDLPVVGRGEVVKSWSETATTIAEAWKRTPSEEFTIADVADTVDVTKRQVRRVLDEFVTAGFLERHDPGEGRANAFSPRDQPGAGEVSLGGDVATPDADPGQDPLEVYYTANVRVAPPDSLLDATAHAETTPLPAPNTIGDGKAVAGPPD